MADNQTPLLVEAVSRLTVSVEKLHQLLKSDYPKRSEVERTFVSKLENQKVITKVILVALITIIGCYVTTIGAYSQCLVGTSSPGICEYVPGYDDRVERRDEIDDRFSKLEGLIREQRLQGQGNK